MFDMSIGTIIIILLLAHMIDKQTEAINKNATPAYQPHMCDGGCLRACPYKGDL